MRRRIGGKGTIWMEEQPWCGGPDWINSRVLHITIGAFYALDQVECLDNLVNNMRRNGSIQFTNTSSIDRMIFQEDELDSMSSDEETWNTSWCSYAWHMESNYANLLVDRAANNSNQLSCLNI